MEQKRCSKCGELKALSEFYKRKDSKDGLVGQCKACYTASGKRYRDANPEKEAARHKQYRDANPDYIKRWHKANPERRVAYDQRYRDTHTEQIAAYGKQWYETYRERAKATSKQYYVAHCEEYAASAKRWREANPEKVVAYQKQWRDANPEKWAGYSQHRRALKAAATIEDFDIMEVWEREGYTCAYCGSTENLTIDHIVALADGGSHSLDNLTVACMSCNSSKGAKPLIEWLLWKTQLQMQLGQC